MKDFDAVMMVENGAETEEEYYSAIQQMINSGNWSLQGSFGRTMMAAIKSGKCMLGPNPARDYYGSRIPSRTEVQEGTKGSKGFVVNHSGEEWATLMEEVR